MSKSRSSYDDELDLVEIFETLWHSKWLIASAVVFSLLSVFVYQFYQPQPNFIATTNIKPIDFIEEEKYQHFNTLNIKNVVRTVNPLDSNSSFDNEGVSFKNIDFPSVSSNILLNLYIDYLDQRTVFKEAILKYELLDMEKFEDEQLFNEAVIKFANSIKIFPPSDVYSKGGGIESKYASIQVEYNDKYKWEQLLKYVNSSTNEHVRKFLKKSFEDSLLVAKQMRDFQVEDTYTKIENVIADYDRATIDRLSYLKEQAAIARRLGVAVNKMETLTFGNTTSSMIANLQTETPYYLRGYESIEKQIDLIEKRQNKKPFIKGLHGLEKNLRKLKQDKIYERTETLFKNTPIIKDDEFYAASMKSEATKFKTRNNKILKFTLTALVGGIIASFYVLILNAMRRRKDNSVKA